MSNQNSFIDWEYPINNNYFSIKNRNKFTKNEKPKFNLYFIFLFLSIFGFLFFLTISISYASSKEETENSDDIFITVDSKEYFEEFIFGKEESNNESKDDNNLKYTIKKIEFQRYRVKSNDSIKSIAKKFGLLEDTIILCNNLKSEKNIKPGDIIEIPNQDGRIVKVNSNDTIFKLASRYGVKWEYIVDVNQLDSSHIKIGSKIFIPGSKMTQYEKNKFYELLYIWPLKGKITSYFGQRIDPITGGYGYHTGIDIKNVYGYPIRATANGVVNYIGFNNVYGNYIEIKHNEEIVSVYAHLSAVLVKQGTEVKKGDIIGRLGNTGRSTGPHLHFEIRKKGKFVDPLKILM